MRSHSETRSPEVTGLPVRRAFYGGGAETSTLRMTNYWRRDNKVADRCKSPHIRAMTGGVAHDPLPT
jgi:hypothetical protein